MTDCCCRVCKTPLRHTFADLGLSPLANSYVPLVNAKQGEMFYPLHAYVCEACFLVQLESFQTPQAIFSNYAYFSSYSSSWLRHAEDYTIQMQKRFDLSSTSKVVEVASNDGYLLQYFVSAGVAVLGVEPAANVAAVARDRGVPTDTAFFGEATAIRLAAAGHMADLTVANNVLAHVPDILDFVSGFAILLKPSGAGTFEFPHLLKMVEQKQFDTIYHEHLSYLSLSVVIKILKRNKLRVFDVEALTTHGGSLRVFFCHEASSRETSPAVDRVLEAERTAGLHDLAGYTQFSKAVVDIKCATLQFLTELRLSEKKVCAYGAAAKGNTFLNYCGIGPEFIEAVADRSPHKQNTLLPGSRIPVVSPDELVAMQPDYVFILPWNLKEEIMAEMDVVHRWGGHFVTAIPNLALS